MTHPIIEKLKKELADFEPTTGARDIGIVASSSDGIIRVTGLAGAMSQELLFVDHEPNPVPAIAFNLEEDSIGAVLLDAESDISVGARVRSSGNVLSIPVGAFLLGRVIDPIGTPLDGGGTLDADLKHAEHYPLERSAPSVVSREGVNEPLQTGVTAVDAMIPVGRGQRELIIGDRQTGKTAIAVDTILNQHPSRGGKPVVCIYVAIGQKQSKIASIIRTLKEADALQYTVVVAAPASAPAAMQYLAPYAGAAIGEYFMYNGKDALVIYDDLSKHAVAYRQLSLLLRRPPGREAYPGDVFYLHARLLERAAKLDKASGGGSLTALPIIETQLGDVSAYVPTNVISITDGQIYLESELFHQGIRPAINVGLSVSRVGSSAQTKAMKKVAGKLRLELAQFRELASFAQFASDLDDRTKERLTRGALLTEVLKQDDGAPRTLAEQVVLLHAAIGGAFDGIAPSGVRAAAHAFATYIHELHRADIIDAITKERVFTDDLAAALEASERQWRAGYNG